MAKVVNTLVSHLLLASLFQKSTLLLKEEKLVKFNSIFPGRRLKAAYMYLFPEFQQDEGQL